MGLALRRTRWSLLASSLGVSALLAVAAVPASAVVIGQERYSGSEPTHAFTECDFALNVSSTFFGSAHLRVLKGGQAFLLKDTYHYRDVFTNPETGQWFVVRGSAVFHEIKGTQVSGNIYRFVAIEAGQPFVVEDSSGKVVVRDRGVIRTTILFDTLGDFTPGGKLISVEDETVHGPHPGFDLDFCALAAELTGA